MEVLSSQTRQRRGLAPYCQPPLHSERDKRIRSCFLTATKKTTVEFPPSSRLAMTPRRKRVERPRKARKLSNETKSPARNCGRFYLLLEYVHVRGISLMVEHQFSKLRAPVRFRHPAPNKKTALLNQSYWSGEHSMRWNVLAEGRRLGGTLIRHEASLF